MKIKIPLLLLLPLLFGTEIASGRQFLNHVIRHGSESFRSSMPVDVVFSRIKREFGLNTWIDVLTGSRAGKKREIHFATVRNRGIITTWKERSRIATALGSSGIPFVCLSRSRGAVAAC